MTDARITAIVADARDLARTRQFYEQQLGFRPQRPGKRSVRYRAGLVDLEVRSARHFGVEVDDGVDESALMVFLVDSVDAARAVLESRGVEFQPTLRYEIGATAACFDPDGHNITLYEPSAEAMTWPSAAKIREIAARSGAAGRGANQILGACPLVYLFLFVRETSEARSFYRDALQLPALEQDDEAGVVKYDGGGVILATHVVGGDAWCAVDMDLTRAKRIVPVIEVADRDLVLSRLSTAGVRSAAGPAARGGDRPIVLQDPNGHRFQLDEAIRKPREDARLTVS